MPRFSQQRRAASMLELLVVVSLLGVFAAVGAARFGPETLWDIGAATDARRLSLALKQARRLAIKTGDQHYVRVLPSLASPEGFQLYELVGGTSTAVDEYREFTDHVTVTPSAVSTLFSFEGESSGATSYTLAGPDQTYTVEIVPATGAVRVRKL